MGTPTVTFYARGHSDFGHVAGSDVSWGRSGPEGMSMQLSATSIDLPTAQTLMPVDSGITDVLFTIGIRLVSAALQVIQRAYGLPDSAFSGGLQGGSPTAEILNLQDLDVGKQERQLYSLGPGAVSTRRIDVFRAKISDLGELAQAKTAWMLPQATWRALAPATGPAVKITDNT